MHQYPLLDIQDARKAADEALGDMAYYVETLQADSEGHYPPASLTLLADIAALRELLGSLFSVSMQAAIAEERTQMDEDAARWEPSGY
ncbi:MAG TPA: hypothetical protein VI542_06100 [Candidatus Tectomicrobia bacterium]